MTQNYYIKRQQCNKPETVRTTLMDLRRDCTDDLERPVFDVVSAQDLQTTSSQASTVTT